MTNKEGPIIVTVARFRDTGQKGFWDEDPREDRRIPRDKIIEGMRMAERKIPQSYNTPAEFVPFIPGLTPVLSRVAEALAAGKFSSEMLTSTQRSQLTSLRKALDLSGVSLEDLPEKIRDIKANQ